MNQENYYDCGLYVLHYVREFINSPEDFTKSFLERDVKNIDFLDPGKEKITGMRLELRDLIVDLHTKYEAQQLCFGQETKKIRDEDSSAAASAEDDDDPVEHNLTSADKPGDQSAEADIRGEVVKDGEPLAEEQESAIKDGDSSGEGERSGEPSDEGKSAIKDGDPVDEDNAQDTVVLGGDDNKPGLGDYWETPNQPSQVL